MAALVLGSIVFKDYEIPERVHFGVAHRLATHRLLGGQRVIDAMGPDDSDPAWHGRFQGTDASDRARALLALAASGSQVPLVFGTFRYMVVVAHAEADFEAWYQVPYSVHCTVASSPFGAAGLIPASLDTLVSGDIGLVTSLIGGLL